MAYELRFLESYENVRRAIAEATGREPSATVARGVSVCLQQGRMFFEAATEAPLEIRPLLLFYGMVAFGRAVIAGRTNRNIDALPQSHGVRDLSEPNSRLADLRVRIGGAGTFYEFNDKAREFEGVTYLENWTTRKHKLPTATSAQLEQVEISLKEILARITGLQDLYKMTFREDAKSLSFALYLHSTPGEHVELRIDTSEHYQDRNQLSQLVAKLRDKHRTLQRWRLSSAEKAWDKSILVFVNVPPIDDELSPERLPENQPGIFRAFHLGQPPPFQDFRKILDPTIGSITPSFQALVEPLNGGRFVSEASLQYLGMFLLSSLVRYRPQIWVHAVTRLVTAERPADDQVLALVERFMDGVQGTFPLSIVQHLTEP